MDARYRSALNRDVTPAARGEFRPLAIGPLSVWPPVVLAPMAGVTNPPFRTLCRRFGAGLYVSEMITARALVEGNRKTLLLASFGSEETTRSLQLYGVDPRYVGEAVRLLVGEGRVDHLDMNFGCPVRKVTRKGGGAAIPLKPKLLRGIVRAAVAAAERRAGHDQVPDRDRRPLRDLPRRGPHRPGGRLRRRRAARPHGGAALRRRGALGGDRRAEARGARIPVLGNGDVWEAEDALRMMRTTGCDGVIVGRGCLGRPWLFRDLASVFDGREPEEPPRLGGVVDVMLEHARLLAAWLGEEGSAMRAFRKHSSWYTKGFPGGAPLRQRLMQVTALAELEDVLGAVDRSLPFPPEAMRVPRGKTAGTQKVALPEGYLDHLDDDIAPGIEAEAADSGG